MGYVNSYSISPDPLGDWLSSSILSHVIANVVRKYRFSQSAVSLGLPVPGLSDVTLHQVGYSNTGTTEVRWINLLTVAISTIPTARLHCPGVIRSIQVVFFVTMDV